MVMDLDFPLLGWLSDWDIFSFYRLEVRGHAIELARQRMVDVPRRGSK